jgi:hypothetical protein
VLLWSTSAACRGAGKQHSRVRFFIATININFLQSSDGIACMTWLDFGSFLPLLFVRRAASRGNMVRTCKRNCFALAYCGLQCLALRVNTQLLHGIMSSRHHVVIVIIV